MSLEDRIKDTDYIGKKLKITRRESCGNYSNGNCDLYKISCFHTPENRCYKLVPRDESEMSEWMQDGCAECNETGCSDCYVYIEYFKKLKEENS